MTTIVPRTVWGVPVTGDPVRVPASKRTGFVVHWDGGVNPRTEADEVRLMLAYHRHHLITLRAGGFGYNLAVGPVTGKVYQGRGLDTRGAHAGGANTPNIGVVLIGGLRNLTHAAKQGLREAYAIACTHTGRTLKQLAHRDVNTTACLGDDITRWIHGGGLTRSNNKTPPPVTQHWKDTTMRIIATTDKKRCGSWGRVRPSMFRTRRRGICWCGY